MLVVALILGYALDASLLHTKFSGDSLELCIEAVANLERFASYCTAIISQVSWGGGHVNGVLLVTLLEVEAHGGCWKMVHAGRAET